MSPVLKNRLKTDGFKVLFDDPTGAVKVAFMVCQSFSLCFVVRPDLLRDAIVRVDVLPKARRDMGDFDAG